MSQAQSTVLFKPHVPMPLLIRYKMQPTPYGDERGDGEQDVPTPRSLVLNGADDIIGDIVVGLVTQDERFADRCF
jgi:hypothetical protein